ncbi:MAG: OmpA family protein [Microscillaceae bacterium]|nr:OmpA family protein [Microscillaceae bacterium]MDW8460680.1 OmpA family protein [Cytophagales bacterium]
MVLFSTAPAQKKGKEEQKAPPTLTQAIKAKEDSTKKYQRKQPIEFKNINRIRYYHNKEKLDQIKQYNKKKEWLKAYLATEQYVKNFGIENFYKDTYLLWRYAKLAELFGDMHKAKFLYQLLLKHHRGKEVKRIQLYYDTITVNEKDYYVPLSVFYKMVNAASNVDTLDVPEGTFTNLGDSINSPFADYAPTITGKDRYLVFTSQRKRRQVGEKILYNEDLYYSYKADTFFLKKTSEGTKIDTIAWREAKELEGLNTPYNEGSACISRDGKTIFFSRCNAPDGYGDCDIYTAERVVDSIFVPKKTKPEKKITDLLQRVPIIKTVEQEKGTYYYYYRWGNVKNLGLNVNSVSWDSQPALSHTEDSLFFASDRLGGFGLTDIYVTIKNKQTGKWGKALNLGPVINTRAAEVSPFYHPKYPILYFSSNGHLVNFGDFDVYKSYKLANGWSEAKNLGPYVNKVGRDYYFTMDSQSEKMYYAKADTLNPQNLDIHFNNLPMEAQPLATVSFKGVVKDSITGQAFKGIVSIIDLDNGIEVAPKYLRPDGSYEFDLIKDNNYLVVITGEDFFRVEREFLLKGDTTITIETPSIRFKKWKFNTIEFAGGSANVTPSMEPDLNKLVLFLADNPKLGLIVSGHTDSDGEPEANLKLSQRRADAIKQYILNKGRFDEKRIKSIGYGSQKPIVTETTNEDKRINRRVEFEIFKLED